MSTATSGREGEKRKWKDNVKPPGLVVIHKACSSVYSDQPNPRQASALVKYWLGGPDPLDYIFMYYNPGSQEGGVAQSRQASPPHWHYVTCGLSDLHGDGRVHNRATDSSCPSGFGFELTFRLSVEATPTHSPVAPPTWPAELLQNLARYVFSSTNLLYAGDHVSWHVPLDPQQDSQMQHMLLAPDPQLPTSSSSLGTVQFVQVVGITSHELKAAQTWHGSGILELMKKSTSCGGELLVTNMRRGQSVFDALPEAWGVVEEGVRTGGSVLSAVSTLCKWEDERGVAGSAIPPETSIELMPRTVLNKAHLILTLEALQLLPLVIRGRLFHGHHFTFKSGSSAMAITMVTAGVEGAMASEESPLVSHGAWLQVYLSREICSKLLRKVNDFLQLSSVGVASDESASCELEAGWLAQSIEQHSHPSQLPATLTIAEMGVVITVFATPTSNGLAPRLQ